jgi:dihydroorotate dehydrogenase electron transfer subunit
MDEQPAARIQCSPRMIPGPGQYLLAHAERSKAPLAAVLFAANAFPDGFVAAPSIPADWAPGTLLQMRGPLGHGFRVPSAARRIALIAFDDAATRLLYLLTATTPPDASITLVCAKPPHDLPLDVEVQPLAAVADACRWSDYAALDLSRESIPALLDTLGNSQARTLAPNAEALVRAPMPCGGLAQCGVCTVRARHGSQLACEDGPVFDLRLLFAER